MLDKQEHEGSFDAVIDKKAEGLKTMPVSDLFNERYRVVTISLAITWSVGAFSFYFAEFYMKYLEASIFYTAMLMSISDLISGSVFYFLTKVMPIKHVLAGSFGLLLIFSIILTWVVNIGISDHFFLAAIMLTFVRLFSGLGFNTSYIANLDSFPILLRSASFAVTNVCCRAVSIAAPIFADEVANPLIWMSALALLATWASFNTRPLLDKIH